MRFFSGSAGDAKPALWAHLSLPHVESPRRREEQPAIQHNSCHITGLAQHRTLPQPASEESHMPRQHQTCIENRSSTAKKRGLALDDVSHFSPQILQSGGSQQLGSAATFWPPNIDHLFLRNILTGNQNVKTDSKRI